MNARDTLDHRRVLPENAEVELQADRMRARVKVPADHPAFDGHFPGRPILPGVLLLSWMMGCARTLIGSPEPAIFCQNVKFLRAVLPGDTLELTAAVDAGCYHTRIRVGTEVASTATFHSRA